MEKIKKALILTLTITFMCQNVIFCLSEKRSTLRVPVDGSSRVKKVIVELTRRAGYSQVSPETVFALLSKGQYLTVEQIANALGESNETIQQVLDFLLTTAVIEKVEEVYGVNPILKSLDTSQKPPPFQGRG
jgi:Fic family protein